VRRRVVKKKGRLTSTGSCEELPCLWQHTLLELLAELL
jgi:hypothetical protein